MFGDTGIVQICLNFVVVSCNPTLACRIGCNTHNVSVSRVDTVGSTTTWCSTDVYSADEDIVSIAHNFACNCCVQLIYYKAYIDSYTVNMPHNT